MPSPVDQPLRVRPASLDDADAIASIHVQGYEDAYRGLVPDAVIDARPLSLRRRVWSERIAGAAPRQFVIVAELGGEVTGFSSGRLAAPDEGGDGERIGCWENLYLHPGVLGSADGMKVGFALHSGTLEQLAACGFPEAVNFVIDGNDRARRFFEAVGWRPDGTDVEREGVVHHRHRRQIPGASRNAA